MAGTREGGLKARARNLARDPNWYKKIGAKGGSNGKGPGYKGGFASNEVGEDGLTGRERAKLAGAVGGKRSRRGPAKDDIEKAEEVLKAEVEKDGGN